MKVSQARAAWCPGSLAVMAVEHCLLLSFISISSRTVSHFTGETFFMRIFILSTICVNLGPRGTVGKLFVFVPEFPGL